MADSLWILSMIISTGIGVAGTYCVARYVKSREVESLRERLRFALSNSHSVNLIASTREAAHARLQDEVTSLRESALRLQDENSALRTKYKNDLAAIESSMEEERREAANTRLLLEHTEDQLTHAHGIFSRRGICKMTGHITLNAFRKKALDLPMTFGVQDYVIAVRIADFTMLDSAFSHNRLVRLLGDVLECIKMAEPSLRCYDDEGQFFAIVRCSEREARKRAHVIYEHAMQHLVGERRIDALHGFELQIGLALLTAEHAESLENAERAAQEARSVQGEPIVVHDEPVVVAFSSQFVRSR